MADITSNIQIDGIVRQREELERLMMGNPQMEKRVQKLIRKVLMQARSEIGKGIQFKHGDPRQAYKAVKTAVYKRILGGSVSLLNKRRRGAPSSYEPPRKLRPRQRGGNRVLRGQRTDTVMHYDGADRAFVLRFLNAGTTDRTAGTRGGRLSGNRGAISARNFFSSSSYRTMQKAADQLTKLIDDMIKQEFNK